MAVTGQRGAPRTYARDRVLTEALYHARNIASRNDPAGLYELHSQVSRLATNRRRRDPEYMQRMEDNSALARAKIHAPPRFTETTA